MHIKYSTLFLHLQVVSIAEGMMTAGGRLSMDATAAGRARGMNREQQQRLATFAAQAPAFVLLDFRCVGWEGCVWGAVLGADAAV
jgi:hypothetical protein